MEDITITCEGIDYLVKPFAGIDGSSFVPYVAFKTTINGKQRSFKARYNLSQYLVDDGEKMNLNVEEVLMTMLKAELLAEIKLAIEEGNLT